MFSALETGTILTLGLKLSGEIRIICSVNGQWFYEERCTPLPKQFRSNPRELSVLLFILIVFLGHVWVPRSWEERTPVLMLILQEKAITKESAKLFFSAICGSYTV